MISFIHLLSKVRFLILFGCLGALFFLFYLHFDTPYQQFADQANSFRQGKLYLEHSGSHDMVEKDGKYYWPNGPFPSITILPSQYLLGDKVTQSHVQLILIVVTWYFLYKLARLRGLSVSNALYTSIGFLCGTFIISLLINPKSWLFAQVVCVCFLTILLYEWETRKRAFILGMLACTLFATRPTAGIFILVVFTYFAYKVWREKNWRSLRSLLLLLIPIGVTGLLLLWFNYARFGNPLDNGYVTNNIGPTSDPLREIGVFSLHHIPMNFYWYFLASYEDVVGANASLVFPFITYSDWGLSIFLTSAFFGISVLSLKQQSWNIRAMWFVVLITLSILLMYFNTGWKTYGPRYAADFMPIIYLLTLYALPGKLVGWHKNLIIVTSIINCYLLYTTPLDK